MAIKFFNDHALDIVSNDDIKAIAPKAVEALHTLNNKSGAGNDFLGWVDLPTNYDKEEFARIKNAADYIKKNADVLVVIGIGGSYLGARAVIEALTSPNYNALKKDTPDIYFIGNSISPSALNEVVSICEGKDICVNVISKSGTTTEPAIAFRVFRDLVNNKYSKEEAAKRIFATTDKSKGTLKCLADEEGYETFVVPDDVGGRYSVLTAVGLLPIAVAGIDIDALMAGAQKAQNELCSENIDENDVLKYAAVRNVFYDKGTKLECFVSYEPCMAMFSEWLKQLFAESEGKDGKAPSNYRSYFGGPAWTKVPGTNKYYLHTFAKEQPDLNWENPVVRKKIYEMINWWFEKGISGFRIDAIINIKKNLDFPSFPADGDDGLVSCDKMLASAHGIGTFLEEMKHETFDKYDAFTVGEVFHLKEDELREFIGEDGHFSTKFDFSAHVLSYGEHG